MCTHISRLRCILLILGSFAGLLPILTRGAAPALPPARLVIDEDYKAWVEYDVLRGFLYSIESSETLAAESYAALPDGWCYGTSTMPTSRRYLLKQLPLPSGEGGAGGGIPLPARQVTIVAKALRGAYGESTGLYLQGTVDGVTWKKQLTEAWPSTPGIAVISFTDPAYHWTFLVMSDGQAWDSSDPALPQTSPWTAANQTDLTAFLAHKDEILGQLSRPNAQNNPPAPPALGSTRFLRVKRTEHDSDGSGMPDWWEYREGFDPFSRDYGDAPSSDPDADGLTNQQELILGTHPLDNDTDDDGVRDGEEVSQGTDPANVDEYPPHWRTILRSGDIGYNAAPPGSSRIQARASWELLNHYRSPIQWPGFAGVAAFVASELPFPADQPSVTYREFQLTRASCNSWGVRFQPGQYSDYVAGFGHTRTWLDVRPARATDIVRHVLLIKDRMIGQAPATSTMEVKTFTISANSLRSGHVELMPNPTGADLVEVNEALSLVPIEITARKKGTSAVPENGVLLKKGDVLELAINPVFFSQPIKFQNQISWQFRNLLTDGTYTSWFQLVGSTTGTVSDHTLTSPGVYQIKAVISGGGGEHLYVRRKVDVVNGVDLTLNATVGDPDAVGVCDSDHELTFCREAQSYFGNTDYQVDDSIPAKYGFPAVGKSEFKCNIFIAHVATAIGMHIPKINGRAPPLDQPPVANQWAAFEDTKYWVPGTQYDIDNWLLVTAVPTEIRPGWIVAHGGGSVGHVAVVDYDGNAIGAGSGSGSVNKHANFFTNSYTRYRKYAP